MIKQRKIWKYNQQTNRSRLDGVQVYYSDSENNTRFIYIDKKASDSWLIDSENNTLEFYSLKDAVKYAETKFKGGVN